MSMTATTMPGLSTLLRLGRISNVPTVWTNVLAGAVIAGGALSPNEIALVMLAMTAFYVGGMYLLTAPDWWNYHKIWISIFQWLVLPLPVLAWFCEKPRGGRVLFASH